MDDHSSEETHQEKTGLDSLLTRLYRPGPLVFLFSIVFIGLVTLGYHLLTEETPPPSVLIPSSKSKSVELSSRVYEEETVSDMEDRVKQADLAIIETMRDTKLKMSELDLVDVELRRFNGRGYHFQVLQIPSVIDRNLFLRILSSKLHKRVPEASLLDNGTYEAAIAINEIRTHRLLLESVPMRLPRPESKGPKLVIVIDDIGENHKVLKGLVDLNIPLTFAVWPHATNTRASVELISQKRHDLIIHFPMEPKGYPKVKPGDDALFVSMTAVEIRKQIAENLGRIPEAIGVNNHMGSQFTAYEAGMDIAMAEFKRHGLFFLDSLTSGESVGRKVAEKTGIPFHERDTFLDNVKDVSAIVHQLKKTERVAIRQGHAIAIGHPYPETLAALKQWSNNRDKTIIILPISKLSFE
ncbi:MAG: divergent polysaccharide deacetylase family protein [Pseudodesulfovibrio sp.]|nr:divergent polysaccharide deacetylase family protein [Pseudodesulfovibrio sp.]